MTGKQIFEAVRSSQPSDWHREELRNVHGHALVATLNSNASIKIQWGKTCEKNFREPQFKTILTPEVSSEYSEVLHEGHPILTEIYLVAENRRALLPMPNQETREVPADKAHFVGLLNALSGNDSHWTNAYIKKNEIEETEEEWPRF
jgi:hypothetical protein